MQVNLPSHENMQAHTHMCNNRVVQTKSPKWCAEQDKEKLLGI